MPKALQSAQVLDGLAAVVAYERDPTAFYLRVYVPEQRAYRQRRVPGARTLQEARQRAAEVYGGFMQPGPASGPRRGTKPGTKLRPRKNNLRDMVEQFLALQVTRVEAGEITNLTLKGKRETVLGHLLPFCVAQGVACSTEISIDTFKGYAAYRAQATPNTKRKELGHLREFLAFLAERDALKPEVEAKRDSLLPKIKRTGEDNTANPPIPEADWSQIDALLDDWCEEGRAHPNRRVFYSRRMLQCLFRFLYASGMRPKEARALRWRDVEFSTEGFDYFHGEDSPRPTQISRQEYERMKAAVDQGAVLDIVAVPKEIVLARVLKSKNRVVREVPCDAAQLLRRWRTLQQQFSPLPLTCESLVFSVPTNDGGTSEFCQNTFNITWRKIIARLDGKLQGPVLSRNAYTPYSLRHSRAVHLIDCGVGVYEAAKMLGHTVQTFEQHYAPYLSRKRGAELVTAMVGKSGRD
jgi:integrase